MEKVSNQEALIKNQTVSRKTNLLQFNYIVGNDNGNSEHDIIINGHKICQPNVLSKVSDLPLLDDLRPDSVAHDIENRLIATVDSPSAQPGIYYIGNYALKSGETIRNIEVGVDNKKYDSEIVIINTIGQISGYAAKQAYEKIKSPDIESADIKVKVDMTTALPISQYSKHNGELFAKKFMNGKHMVTVQLATLRVHVEVIFDFVRVIPEGVTAVHFFRNIRSENLDIFKEFEAKYNCKITDGSYFKNKKILHVAIGDGTTDYPITNDVLFDPSFIQGSDNGIAHAIDKALPKFKKKYRFRTYSRQKYSEVLRDENHKYHDVAKDFVNEYINEECTQILLNVKEEIEKANNEIDIIAVYGGGSIPMKSQLEPKLNTICDLIDCELLYVPTKYAIIIESIGMYEFTKGPIFKALKERYKKE